MRPSRASAKDANDNMSAGRRQKTYAAAAAVVGTTSSGYGDTHKAEERPGNYSEPYGGYDDEKTVYRSSSKTEIKEEAKASYKKESGPTPKQKEDCATEVDDSCSTGWGFAVVWFIVIFIFIIIVIFGFFWFMKPDCVTRDCEDGAEGRELDPGWAGGLAFGIALLFIIILAAAWWCMAGRK